MFPSDELPPPMFLQQNYGPPPQMMMMPQMYPQRPPPLRTDGGAIGSLVLGICSLGIYFLGFLVFFVVEIIFYMGDGSMFLCLAIIIIGGVLGAVGLFLGIASLRRINASSGSLGGKGLAITGIVLSSVGLGAALLLGIIMGYLMYEYYSRPYYYEMFILPLVPG